MSLLHWYDKADICRQVSIAILDAFLPHGEKARFAEKVGVTRQWFTYIRQAGSFAMPSLRQAKHIADQLPAPDYYRHAFYEHLVLAREAYLRAKQEVIERNSFRLSIGDLVGELNIAHRSATFSRDVWEARNQYQKVLEIANLIVTNTNPAIYPLDFVETCAILVDVFCVLDWPAHGLYWAKLGRLRAGELEGRDLKTEFERLEDAGINAARAEGIAYNNLGLYKRAQECYRRAEALVAKHRNKDFWITHVYRDKLHSLAITPRFTLSDAETLAKQVERIHEHTGDELGVFLIREGLARAYVAYGNAKKARKVLDVNVEQMNTAPFIGQLHRAMVLRTAARLHWLVGDLSSWTDTIRTALHITSQAALIHQYNAILREYGGALTPFADVLSPKLRSLRAWNNDAGTSRELAI